MVSFLNNAYRHRCYFCHQASMNEAYSTDICIRHQLLISIRLLVLLARAGRFGQFWKIVRVKW